MKRRRYLIVQTCHIPHFFFAVRQLRNRFPDAEIEALVLNHEQVRYYVGLFGILDKVHYLPETPQDEYDGVIFPLLNRGYRTIKRNGWAIKGPKLDLDFDGNVEPLSLLKLRKSYFLPLHPFTGEFQEYLAAFPHRPIGESVLFCHSCDRTLVRKMQPQVSKYLAPKSDICVVRSPSLRRALRRIEGRSFDSAVVFFSAEKGFAHLKLLPFLLRIPKILVVNENGDCFYASARSLASFLLLRIRSGFRQPRPMPPRLLVFQTADADKVQQAVRRIKRQKRFMRSEIMVVSDRADWDRFHGMPEVKRVLLSPEHRGLFERIRFWRRLRRLAPDLTFAILGRGTGNRFRKLLFWLVPARRFFFRANLDCYRFSPGTLLLPLQEYMGTASESLDPSEGTILYIDGTRSPAAPEAIEMLEDSRIVRQRPIIVLCRANRKPVFQASPRVLGIVTFEPWNPLSKLIALVRCTALHVDVIAGIFAGRRLSRLHQFLLFTLPARHRLVFNQYMACFYADTRSARRFLGAVFEATALTTRAARTGHTLFVDTTRAAGAAEAVKILNSPRIGSKRPIEVLCREDRRQLFENLPGVRKIHSYAPGRPLDILKTIFLAASFDTGIIAGVFAGKRRRRLMQFLIFLLPAGHRLIFNQYGGCFYADRDHSSLLLRNLIEATPPIETVRPILFIDKPGSHRAPQAVRRLGDPKIMREQRPVTVLCPRGREALYRGIPGVGRIWSYGPGRFALALLGVRRVVGLRPEMVATVLDGRRSSRLAQLFALALPTRHRLIFNQNVDCFYLSFASSRAFWRSLRERDEIYARAHSYCLFVQTAEDDRAVKALQMLKDPSVARPRPILVFCRRDKVPIFSQVEGVQCVYTYEPGNYYSNLRTVAQFLHMDIEVIAAVFTGRPIYRLQKLLFFGLPARNRLAFNSHLDCFYLTRQNWSALFARDKRRSTKRLISPSLRAFLKLLFFFPRFLFVVIWVTGLKMKRAYTQSPEVK